MNQIEDPLVEIPMEKWSDLQKEFQQDWPRSIAGYWALEVQREWRRRGLEHDFHVYCPYGDVRNGMVISQIKGPVHDLLIQCPHDDTTKIQEALQRTNRIEWNRRYVIPCPPSHITQCIQAVMKDIKMVIRRPGTPHHMFLLPKETPIFEDIRLSEGVTFKMLTEEHIDIVDSTWVNRHTGSDWFFKLLVKAKSGYGIFQNGELACFVFTNEIGFLTHLFTLEKFRKKGYAEILLKSVCNILFKENKDVYCYVMEGNDSAIRLYHKLGFKKYHCVLWGFLAPESSKL
ncbi:uncharacterized protein LOC128673003 [Plodia interpunctella]|uniref:uncharacterized protein LOC128673003 n=1 Tax=Plodia interpunctella TaxID=58824 RepID=UPI002368ACAC|nr:uncharacterized protein LOC128673003 [Plodia interpunctella]XP_053606546.1 uncharacterized protein LOC128673003 [Plodia interpunctella]XP_053606547.1 uncharacterized protein LOC128673003 [Plodia interpunctella]XP_053606548.1 uncharacterized protein LOC128673003 [Plodia interpunctella]XP_053606549.1 uncharacterized protein LOC128673003 [Plodia interpunctella]XP_053606550.1 uncharacterized protein LOC128673003 [Plodia interpunctella]XP_053606551.1 uncharacterized protein LOC128673003 [Plodia